MKNYIKKINSLKYISKVYFSWYQDQIIDDINSLIYMKWIEFVIENHVSKRTPDPNDFTVNSIKHLKKK